MSASDEFAAKVTTKAVAQACAALGVSETQTSVLNSLSDVVGHYIETIGRRAHDNAERAGRSPSQISLVDILTAFAETPSNSGCISWRDLRAFAFPSQSHLDANMTEENIPARWNQPFRHSVPFFPVSRKNEGLIPEAEDAQTPSASNILSVESQVKPIDKSYHEQEYRSYIPTFFPPLPPKYTYCKTPKRQRVEVEDQSRVRHERLKRRRQTEDALRKIGHDHKDLDQLQAMPKAHYGEIDSYPLLPRAHRSKPPLREFTALKLSRPKLLKLKPHKLDKVKKEDLILDGAYFEAGDTDR